MRHYYSCCCCCCCYYYYYYHHHHQYQHYYLVYKNAWTVTFPLQFARMFPVMNLCSDIPSQNTRWGVFLALLLSLNCNNTALTKHHAMKAYWIGGIATRILELGTRLRWIVSFTFRSLYPQGKSPCYPLDRRLRGPQSRSASGGEEIPSPCRNSNPWSSIP
jgi:hypothetical protein